MRRLWIHSHIFWVGSDAPNASLDACRVRNATSNRAASQQLTNGIQFTVFRPVNHQRRRHFAVYNYTYMHYTWLSARVVRSMCKQCTWNTRRVDVFGMENMHIVIVIFSVRDVLLCGARRTSCVVRIFLFEKFARLHAITHSTQHLCAYAVKGIAKSV